MKHGCVWWRESKESALAEMDRVFQKPLRYDRMIKKVGYEERRQVMNKKMNLKQGGRDEATERARVTAGAGEWGS